MIMALDRKKPSSCAEGQIGGERGFWPAEAFDFSTQGLQFCWQEPRQRHYESVGVRDCE
jgi:hypothetical protein